MENKSPTEILREGIELMKTPEGQKSIRKFVENINLKDEIRQAQLERVHTKYGHRFSELVEKILDKYESEKYKSFWLRCGYYDAPCDLKHFLFDYAKKFGREATQKEYDEYHNSFSADIYIVDDWVFNLMIGQGSHIQIFKK